MGSGFLANTHLLRRGRYGNDFSRTKWCPKASSAQPIPAPPGSPRCAPGPGYSGMAGGRRRARRSRARGRISDRSDHRGWRQAHPQLVSPNHPAATSLKAILRRAPHYLGGHFAHCRVTPWCYTRPVQLRCCSCGPSQWAQLHSMQSQPMKVLDRGIKNRTYPTI